jgi:hypothetical protein
MGFSCRLNNAPLYKVQPYFTITALAQRRSDAVLVARMPHNDAVRLKAA